VTSLNENHLSDSEKYGYYLTEVRKILKSHKSFINFKRNYFYNIVLEHVKENEGLGYLNILRNRNDGILLEALNSVLITDSIGNPRKFIYPEGVLSPTTLRYVKVASDLRLLFGTDLNQVAEIGCGYGGQTVASMVLNNYVNFTLFDLDDVNSLIKRYLNNFILAGSFITKTINEHTGDNNYDLVISNYAFSELPRKLQLIYISKVISKAKRGYLTMNSGITLNNIYNEKMNLQEILDYLPKVTLYHDEPYNELGTYIIVWGNEGTLERQAQV
jgi:phospholipid N-methyltransferase